jgi:hypothetical protein
LTGCRIIGVPVALIHFGIVSRRLPRLILLILRACEQWAAEP